jgi:putative phosphotransacetylase
MSTKLASKFGLKHNDNVALKVTCPRNSVTFCTVKAQVEDQHAGEVVTCVLDSDEAGACLLADATQFDLYAMQGKIDNSFTFVHLCTTSAIGKVNPARVDTWAREVMSREFKQNYPSSSPVVDVTDVSTTGGNKESSVSFSDEKEFKLNVDVSNRHVHVSPEALEKLYGKNYSLEPYKPIAYLPEWLAKLAAFSAKETVTIKNTETNNEIRNVRILGPPRARSQIELAFTDCQILGIEAPTRISGDNVNSSPIVLIAEDLSSGKPTTRRLNLGTGALRAWRHIHADEDEADRLGFQAGDVLTLAVKSKGSTTLFHDVLARVGGDGDGVEKPGFSLWKLAKPYLMAAAGVYLKWVGRPGLIIHLDTDEGNACFLSDAEYFTLYKQLNDGKGGLKFLGSTKNMAKMPDRRQKMWQEEVKYRANL